MNDELKNFEMAQQAVKNGEAKGLAVATMNRLWRKYFAAETALKAVASWK